MLVFNTKGCCPPNVGNISDNIAKCQSYQYAVIMSLYHRQGGTLIIPGILRHITEDLGQLLPNWKIVVSDRECNTLLDYI